MYIEITCCFPLCLLIPPSATFRAHPYAISLWAAWCRASHRALKNDLHQHRCKESQVNQLMSSLVWFSLDLYLWRCFLIPDCISVRNRLHCEGMQEGRYPIEGSVCCCSWLLAWDMQTQHRRIWFVSKDLESRLHKMLATNSKTGVPNSWAVDEYLSVAY